MTSKEKVLAYDTPVDVKKQVTANFKISGYRGGYVFNTVHNIQSNVPVENIVAMIDEFTEYNGYENCS